MNAQSTIQSQAVNKLELKQFFASICSRLGQTAAVAHWPTQKALQQFFSAISVPIARAKENQRKLDREEATRFNVFDLIDPGENRLSDILKDLLDPKGSHGQGDLFLSLMLEELCFDWKTTGLSCAKVEREVSTYALQNQRRRMDILVEAGFSLAIENKKDSKEQVRQVKDYLTHLGRCSAANHQPYALIYLTPDGHLPPSLNTAEFQAAQDGRRLVCWSYQRELRCWLEACHQKCRAQKIQYFLTDFIKYIATVLKCELQPDQPNQKYEEN